MTATRIAAIGLLCCLVSSNANVFAQSGSRQPKRGIVGKQAPNWKTSEWYQLPKEKASLKDKASLNVSDYKGKAVYLYFFQSWCPGCHRQGFPTLQKVSAAFEDDEKVAFVAIQTTFEGHNVNTADKLKVTADRYKLKIPFGQSAGKRGSPDIMKEYRTGGTPWVVIIDPKGRVVFNDFHVDADRAIAGIRQLVGPPGKNANSTGRQSPR